MRHFQVRSSTAVCVLTALATSLVAHVLSIYFILHMSTNVDKGMVHNTTIPIVIQPAALTTVRAQRFGLYANDSDWESILPPGDGFIYHPEYQEHFLVSHYHQLHCLRSLRHYVRKGTTLTLTPMDLSHIDHCLIYLREMTLCNLDLTLEPASHKQRTPEGKLTNAVTGLGITHQCRNWEQLWNYMEENYQQYSVTYKT